MSESTSTAPSRTSSAAASLLAHPVQTVTQTVSHVPGAGLIKGAFEGVLDTISAVSPHARRVAAYTGAGLLGAAGVIEWPVAAAGAAVVWLTQPRPEHDGAAAAREKPAAAREKPTATAPQRKKAARTAKPASKPAKQTKPPTRPSARGTSKSRPAAG